MSNSQPSSTKFSVFAVVAILASSAGLATLWPLTLAAAHHESAALVGEASSAPAGEAATDYLLATWLDRHNTAAYTNLARTQITAGQPEAALASLQHAGRGSEVDELRVRTLLELGRTSDAAAAAIPLTTPGCSQDDLLLASLAYDVAGRTADATALMPRLTSPEVAQAATRAQSANLALAAELYATGLLRSSSAILVKSPTSYERDLLLGHIRYSQHTRAALTEAVDYLATANALNPTNLEARTLLAKIYSELGNLAASQAQTALIIKLQSNRP
ncbi:MAG TPA: tetratricopeptide repeat protein [Candidatus Saccharimonadia bacterium]|jgi:thioredoxin-like negative regulator of GroEL